MPTSWARWADGAAQGKGRRAAGAAGALPAVQGKGWLAAARADALSRLRAMGLPARRDEYWRYNRSGDAERKRRPPARNALIRATKASRSTLWTG